METTVPLYPAIAIAVVAVVVLSAFFTAAGLDGKATSEESHVVFNYIRANNLPPVWEEQFNAINNDWPPSRNKLARLLLEAQTAGVRRASK